MAELVKNWPGEITIVNGRPRHPQRKRQCESGRNDSLLFCPGQTGYMKFNVSIIIYYISK